MSRLRGYHEMNGMEKRGACPEGGAASRELARRILAGDEKSAARLISLIEEDKEEGYQALSEIYPSTGKAHIIGITGPPGAGKSTLAGRLAVLSTKAGHRVGIVAVDPSSIKHRGALLGDRVRMKDAERLNSVFIRSMAGRDQRGGLARATAAAVYVLEAVGKNIIIVESVGAGQSEKAVSYITDTVVTVFTPDFGDEIQLLKAGIIEIGDIVVVNKSDNQGAEHAKQLLAFYVEQRPLTSWKAPVLLCRADQGPGVLEIHRAIGDHHNFLLKSGERAARKPEKRMELTLLLLREELFKRFLETHRGTAPYDRWTAAVSSGSVDPYRAVRQILGDTGNVTKC